MEPHWLNLSFHICKVGSSYPPVGEEQVSVVPVCRPAHNTLPCPAALRVGQGGLGAPFSITGDPRSPSYPDSWAVTPACPSASPHPQAGLAPAQPRLPGPWLPLVCFSVLSRSLAAYTWGCPGQGPATTGWLRKGSPEVQGRQQSARREGCPRYHSLDPFIPFWLEGSGNHFISALNLEIWGNKLKTAQLFVPSAR